MTAPTPVSPPPVPTWVTVVETPVGPLTLVAGDDGLRAIQWSGETCEADEAMPDDHLVLAAAAQQLEAYFDGRLTQFDLPLDPRGTPFQRAAWDVLRGIGYGETISYGEQARRLGKPSAVRAVGAANGRNPLPIVVPCHRVVGATGRLTGFAAGVDTKAWLLDHERSVSLGRGRAVTARVEPGSRPGAAPASPCASP